MKEFKGTIKGNLRVEPFMDLKNRYAIVDENNKVVANVLSNNDKNIYNSQLLASAHELLEASQLILHYHLCEQEGIESGQPTRIDWLNAIDKLSQVINKALGE